MSGVKIILIVAAALAAVFLVDAVIGRIVHKPGRRRARPAWRDALADLPVTLRGLHADDWAGFDDDGQDIKDIFDDEPLDLPRSGPEGARDTGQSPGPGQPFHDERCCMNGAWPGWGAHSDCPGQQGPPTIHGINWAAPEPPATEHHDDEPTEWIPTARVGDAYLPLSDIHANAIIAPGQFPHTTQPRHPADLIPPRTAPWVAAMPVVRVPVSGREVEVWGRPLYPWIAELLGAPTVHDALVDIVAMAQIKALAA